MRANVESYLTMQTVRNNSRWMNWLTAGIALLMAGGLLATSAMAAPVSPGATTRAAAYQGVVAIVPGGTGDSYFELGATGQDIASSSSDIYLRPSSLAANLSVKFSRSGAAVNVDVPGSVCLGGACRNTWPADGGGGTWELLGLRLLPVDKSWGVQLTGGSSTNPTVSLVADNPAAALYISNINPSGYALSSNDAIEIGGDLQVNGQLTVKSAYDSTQLPVWYSGNDGIGSTLDAGILDGTPIRVGDDVNGGGLNDCSAVDPTPRCFCANGSSATGCIGLYP